MSECMSECMVHTLFARATYGVASVSRIIKLQVSFAKDPNKRDAMLQKRHLI